VIALMAMGRLRGLAALCLICGIGIAAGSDGGVLQSHAGHPIRLRWDQMRGMIRRETGRSALLAGREKRRILILMSDTGGGHRASAVALKAAMEEMHPNQLNVTIVDMYASCASLPWRWIPYMYRRLAKRPLQWRLTVWLFADFKPVRWFCEAWIHVATSSGLRECLQSYDPEMVVSMHAMTNIYPMSALRKLGGGKRKIPVVTVVTDLTTVHPAWFDKGVDACFVASEEAAALARSKGLKPSQLRMYGLPIHPMFGRKPIGKAALRRKLGAHPTKPLVLLVGGGDGVGGLGRLADVVAQELAARFPGGTQLIVVCGKNERVRAELAAKTWHNVEVLVKGFVQPMSEYMAASDCVITKAGPGTVMEAASQGLPVMLSGYLPPQEAGNVECVVRGGFGAYSRKPQVIARTVCSWLADPKILAKLSAKAKQAARPQAVYAIAQDICNMLPADPAHPK